MGHAAIDLLLLVQFNPPLLRCDSSACALALLLIENDFTHSE